MDSCIFCSIIDGAIPNHTVYEDEHVLAFLDITPISNGHTVVIPKKHAATVLELDSDTSAAMMSGIQGAMKRLQEVLSPEGFNFGANHGEAGGQAVGHLHIHVIPRWMGDGGGNMHTIVQQGKTDPVEDIAKQFV
jgi:histidine triad (HIT) family protein